MDDAGVYRITDDIALVQSVDFFFPIVDDPYEFGEIVAANSLSDIWAMGARALTAMNVLAYPAGKIPPEEIEQLLLGASEKLLEAGVSLVGGHTMEQEEFVFGMSVSGVISPDKILRNSNVRIGDKMLLTKPLGTGIYSSAMSKGGLTPGQYKSFVDSMCRLNKYSCEVIEDFAVSGLTDVTGFGLLGHALPMAQNAGVTIELIADMVPGLPDIYEKMTEYLPKGVCKCKAYVKDHLQVAQGVTDKAVTLFSEAQTSGGLLIAVHPDSAQAAKQAIISCGDTTCEIIGTVLPLATQPNGANVYLSVR